MRWIGGPDYEKPAAQVSVTEASEHHGASEDTASEDSDSASKGLGIAALILAALGLLTGGAALIRSRRAS